MTRVLCAIYAPVVPEEFLKAVFVLAQFGYQANKMASKGTVEIEYANGRESDEEVGQADREGSN